MQVISNSSLLFSVSRPVEILGDGIGRDGILEASAVGVAFNHYFDKGAVYHVHFGLAVFILEIHALCRRQSALSSARSLGTVQSSVMLEKGACVPQRLGVFTPYIKDSMHFLTSSIGKIVDLYKRRKICIKGGKGLCARPFVLHDAEEVDHLIAKGGKMARRRRSDFAGDAAETFLNKLFKTTSRRSSR